MIIPEGYHAVPGGHLATVVTSLEMFARPPLRPEHDGDRWTLRRVERPDPGWYRALFRRIGEDYLWASRLRIDDDALRAIIHDPAVDVFALEAGGADAGLLELDFREPHTCELTFFGVTRPLIGTAAARRLMNHAVDRAWSQPIDRFWVHTCDLDHPKAIAFYVRSGFRPFRREVEVFADPRLDGTLPLDAAAHVPQL